MSPIPQGKQSGKKENPVKVKFPAVVSWPKERYWGLDDAVVKTEKILCTSNGSKGLQNLTNICGYVNLLAMIRFIDKRVMCNLKKQLWDN